MPYDLFISYSRKDNLTNRVTELKNQIENDYLEFAKEPLSCFFDQEEIKGMDDWQNRLLQGLKDSHLLLVILSPNYIASPYCEWEIVEYLKYEYSRGVAGDGVAQVYFMEIPGIDDEDFRANAAAWLEKVSRRQRIDLCHWYNEGADSLKRLDVKKRLEELKESLRKRITRMRVISEVPGNLPAPNPRFVGREREMEMLHKATALGRLGVITAMHGVGGLGKTAIAFQYAYAYANFYPGGRWYLGCANETNIASVIKRLDVDLNITLTEDEKKDDVRGAKRILNELYTKAVENAEKANLKTNIGDSVKDYIKPAVLLILDNVDHPELIQPPGSDIISGKEWLKILVTTRMGPEELGEDGTTQKLLTIDELPFDDGASLIESYQPGGRFKNAEEKEKAGEIVRLLGGFTLAVEVAALYLYEKKGRVSCADFLEILKAKGIGFVGGNTKKRLSHTKLISETLAPTLDSLSPEETLILSYASLLPPDSIPLPWLKALVVKEYPNLGEEEMAGIDNPWISIINHLLSSRLLQVVDWDGQVPRLVRMHRLIGENVINKQKDNSQKFQDDLTNSIKTRCNDLEYVWHQHQWEIMPIIGYAKNLLEIQDHKAAKLLRSLCQWLIAYDDGHYSEPLLRAAIEHLEKHPSDDYKDMSVTLSNLGWALMNIGKYTESENYLRQALAIDEKADPNDVLALAVRYSNLSSCLHALGNLKEAKELNLKALDIREKSTEKDYPNLALSYSNLSTIEYDLKNLKEAKELNLKAITLIEKAFEKEHPYLASAYSNLASIEHDLGNLKEAKELNQKAIEIRENFFEKDRPDLSLSYSNLALVEMDLGNLKEAKELLIKAMKIDIKVYEPWHPNLASSITNLAAVEQYLGNTKDAEVLFRKALSINEQSLPSGHHSIINSFSLLADLLEKTGRYDEAKELRLRSLEHEPSEITPLDLRKRALEYFNLGDYINTETLLNRVLSEKFELSGTYCHLARICILTDRLSKVEEHVEQAWQYRAEAPVYVSTRILWFKIALVFLESSSIENLIGQLKAVLQKEDAIMGWTMQPVLDHIKPQITEHQHALLSALVDAMSNKANLEKLNVFAEWRDAKPEELD